LGGLNLIQNILLGGGGTSGLGGSKKENTPGRHHSLLDRGNRLNQLSFGGVLHYRIFLLGRQKERNLREIQSVGGGSTLRPAVGAGWLRGSWGFRWGRMEGGLRLQKGETVQQERRGKELRPKEMIAILEGCT